MTTEHGRAKAKRGGAKAGADPAKSVMGNLPSTRPTRMMRRREESADAGGATATAVPPKPKPAPQSRPKARSGNGAAKRRTHERPQAVRSGSPSLKRPKAGDARRPRPARPPKGAEIVTTAVQATAELAQIGVTLGGQMVKRAVSRLPKP